MKAEEKKFGTLPDGREVMLFCFEASGGMSVSITNYGGIITSIKVPGRKAPPCEITTGFPALESYLGDHPYFGAIVGRYANRIAGGRFRIGKREYMLARNNGPNHLHGGLHGFDKKLWDYTLSRSGTSARLALRCLSPHMEEGYPGNLSVLVTYVIHDNNSLEILFSADTDAPTHVNLTNHAYLNLGGFGNTIFDHKLVMDARGFLETDECQIPTGRLLSMKNNPFGIGAIEDTPANIIPIKAEADHCFVLNQQRSPGAPAARLWHEASGRMLTLYGTQPGIQVYTANFLDESLRGHGGMRYRKHGAICLETQHFPDSPNRKTFPSTLITPEKKYAEQLRMVFSVV